MAKRKREYTVELSYDTRSVLIVCDERHWVELAGIEGVSSIYALRTIGNLILLIDPRYDASDVMNEATELLEAEVPEVFRE